MHGTTATNAPGDATRRYLAAMRNRGPLSIDRANAPTRHKRYPEAERAVLPWGTTREGAALDLIGELLRELLGVARVVWFHQLDDLGGPLGEPPILLAGRPAPSGGGLYPIEAYVAAGEPRVPGLPAALYHYDPVHHALERVREGDHTPALTGLLADSPAPDVTLVLSAVFWRSMFKYGDFGYRLMCQETGVLLAQALAVAGRLGLATRAHLRFPDGEVDRLLGLDGAREAALAVLTLTLPSGLAAGSHGTARDAAPLPRSRTAGDPGTPLRPLAAPDGAPCPVDGPPLWRPAARESAPLPLPMLEGPAAALHRAGTVGHAPGPSSPARLLPCPPVEPGATVPAPEPAPGVRPAAGVPRRASPPAGYRPAPFPGGALGAILAAAGGGYPGDLPGAGEGPAATAVCLLALRVDGLPRGAYWYDPEARVLGEVAGADRVAAVATGRLLANTRLALRGAAAVLVPVGDPLAGVGLFGDRWYRLQQIEAGLVTQRAALAAAALGLAARIHSDGVNDTTDEVLGIAGTPLRSLSFLVMGTPLTGGPLLARQIPPGSREEVTPTP
ncbi:SagB family peptide dehydrogenase [Sphaerisporangium perillae]|uniref:SagB family peptide dehydrogenase n=1 Tax=Sphaerisporangium perillae TaxID=2935860 RepID=UPI00200F1FB7|nr:SagB family peptide dehydrogenase [Sphaerisporangium perillae]